MWIGSGYSGAAYRREAVVSRRRPVGIIERFQLRQIFSIIDDLPDGKFVEEEPQDPQFRDSVTVSSKPGIKNITVWRLISSQMQERMTIDGGDGNMFPRYLSAHQSLYDTDHSWITMPPAERVYRSDNQAEQNTLGLYAVKSSLIVARSMAPRVDTQD
jgi:hypothetical protein